MLTDDINFNYFPAETNDNDMQKKVLDEWMFVDAENSSKDDAQTNNESYQISNIEEKSDSVDDALLIDDTKANKNESIKPTFFGAAEKESEEAKNIKPKGENKFSSTNLLFFSVIVTTFAAFYYHSRGAVTSASRVDAPLDNMASNLSFKP